MENYAKIFASGKHKKFMTFKTYPPPLFTK